jgi:dihydroxyacetone kinase-like protein
MRSGEHEMTTSGTQQIVDMFQRISLAVSAEKGHLSELDGAIGDADHGITMARGFTAVTKALSAAELQPLSPSDIFRMAASTFLDAVGASTGPLYATAFSDAAQAVSGQGGLDAAAQAELVMAMASGIKRRGKGDRGEKTMLDAWIPAAEAARRAQGRGATVADMWSDILVAATAGADATKSMIAARGRAVRLGERSLGHLDPGAASAVIILDSMRETFTAS